MSPEIIGVIGIVVMLFLILALHMYVGMAMALVGFIGLCFINDFSSALSVLGTIPWSETSSYTLSVIPLFILMGQFATASGMSREIYNTVNNWVGHWRGGLAVTTILACAGFAAVCGSTLATGSTMGQIAIPQMLKYKYDPRLATGCVAAGGTLGILIPPSTGFIIYGVITEQSIGHLFLAGILPGILLTALFVLAINILCKINPSMGPPSPPVKWSVRFKSMNNIGAVLFLFLVVMGGIFLGVFTPTEAGGVGAFGALAIAVYKKRMNKKILLECLSEAGKTTAMIFFVIIGAMIFSVFLGLARIPMALTGFFSTLELSRYLILAGILVVYVFLGCIMDAFAIMIITVPIMLPIIEALGFDLIWFGVIMIVVIEVGFITPPIGLNVLILKGIAPDIPSLTIYRGVLPFVICAIAAIVLLIAFPNIALFVPSLMMR